MAANINCASVSPWRTARSIHITPSQTSALTPFPRRSIPPIYG